MNDRLLVDLHAGKDLIRAFFGKDFLA